MMQVFRDDWGIPHLRAGSVLELAYLQGRTTAADRGHQIDVDRRRSEGRLAELIGPAGLPWDRFARKARLDDTARRCFDRLDPPTREWVSAYSDGVRSRLADWQPWSSLGVFLTRHILFATFPSKMWRAHVTRTLGPSFLELFSREGAAGGSNAWAVPGVIAGDPHRLIELPGVYQQVRLACPEFDVAGLAFPGVPGVQHFGHTGGVAWAVTNAMADYQDLYQEEFRQTADGLEARTATGWEPVHTHTETISVRGEHSEFVEVVETPRGPVVDADLSLRTPTRVELDLGFGALLPLLRASTVDDVAAALRHWVEPVNSVLVADTSGRTLQIIAGRVPLRDPLGRQIPVPAWEPRYEWQGYAEMPSTEVDGVAVTANDRRPDTEPFGIDFAPPSRANRIRALIAEGAAPERIHMDTVLGDVTMDADSTAAGEFAARRTALAQTLYDHPTLAPVRQPSGYDDLFRPWLDPLTRIGTAAADIASALGVDVPPAAAGQSAGRWGERHVLTPVRVPGLSAFDLPRTELSGDSNCVLATHSIPGVTDTCERGPVARYVWDLTDRARSRWIVPFGATDRPGDPHFLDQLPLWASGRLIPLVTDWNQLTEES
jgi:penicillin amidase